VSCLLKLSLRNFAYCVRLGVSISRYEVNNCWLALLSAINNCFKIFRIDFVCVMAFVVQYYLFDWFVPAYLVSAKVK